MTPMNATAQTAERKRRPRRVASDEAHAWARSLPLGNPFAKSVLRALALYVNGEGCCFVSLEQLAEDTDLSLDTVRRRAAWLDQVGAIVRLPQWTDENGRRNAERRGKRTTDEIRLLMDADPDEIEMRAKGAAGGNSGDVSPSHQQGLGEGYADRQQMPQETDPQTVSPRPRQGLNPDADNASQRLAPGLALGQPSQCGEGLISEPEPEPEDSPPTPPPGGVADDWDDFQKDWQEPILHQSICRQIWSSFKPEEKAPARKAARGYVVWRRSQKKPPNPVNAQKFLREHDAWPQFAALAPAEAIKAPPPAFEAEGSESWRARNVIAEICGTTPPYAQAFEEGRGRKFARALSSAELALARFADDDPETWPLAKEGSRKCGAWKRFLGIGSRMIVVGRKRYEMDRGRCIDDWPIKEEGLRVPCDWPPRMDGTLSSTGPPDTLLTEQDVADLDQIKI